MGPIIASDHKLDAPVGGNGCGRSGKKVVVVLLRTNVRINAFPDVEAVRCFAMQDVEEVRHVAKKAPALR